MLMCDLVKLLKGYLVIDAGEDPSWRGRGVAMQLVVLDIKNFTHGMHRSDACYIRKCVKVASVRRRC